MIIRLIFRAKLNQKNKQTIIKKWQIQKGEMEAFRKELLTTLNSSMLR